MTEYNIDTPIENSKKIITDLISGSEELSKFQELTIYGSNNDPLFKISELEKLLEVKNIRQNFKNFDEGQDYIKSGNRLFITEPGFYKLIFVSRTATAKLFQNFVCQILKKLRLTGSVNKEDMENITKELFIQQEENKQKEIVLGKQKNKISSLTFQNGKLEHEVTEYDKSNLSYLQNQELKKLRKQHYKKYNIYRSNDDVFISISDKLKTKFEKIDSIYIDPENGFRNLVFLLIHKIKNKKVARKVANVDNVSPLYEIEHLSELYDAIDESRYYDGDTVDHFSDE
jgi:prophage antirepressor-like protein